MSREILVFELARRRYGAALELVREVFNLGPLTPVPTAPASVAGVANLRGQIVTVLDLGRLLGGGTQRVHLGEPVVLVEVDGLRAGLLVERVVGLARVHEEPAAAPGPATAAASAGTARLAELTLGEAVPEGGEPVLLVALHRVFAAVLAGMPAAAEPLAPGDPPPQGEPT